MTETEIAILIDPGETTMINTTDLSRKDISKEIKKATTETEGTTIDESKRVDKKERTMIAIWTGS